MRRTLITTRPRRPLGGCDLRIWSIFVGPWEVQRRCVFRRSPLDLAVPWGAAICETVATFVGSWEAQRSGVLRT